MFEDFLPARLFSVVAFIVVNRDICIYDFMKKFQDNNKILIFHDHRPIKFS